MADEAYRAVFLRVHPTGKMVLSLTTEADGNEGQYAQLVADELGVPALDVKVVPADENRFGSGHGFNTSPSGGTPAAIASATRQDPRQGAAARRRGARDATTLEWDNGVFVGDGETRTIADIALYAHGTGALPPGRRGRARRTDRLQGLRMHTLGPQNGDADRPHRQGRRRRQGRPRPHDRGQALAGHARRTTR